MAKLMSRAINCQNPNHGDPCGQCEVCRAIQTESTMDVLELDAASNNSVDNIRELLEQVRYPAQMGKYKVYIIDEVHMLSTAAFNALLKTLEEPPAHVVFILATTEPQKLPATILSRVQRYDFGRIPSELMIGRMKEALDELHMTAEPEALQLVARAAEGAMRDAFSILDMCVAGAENRTITAAQVRDALGTSDREFLFAFMDCIADRDAAGVLRKVDELMRSGREPQVFLKDLSSHCRMLMTVQAVKENAAALLDVTTEDEQRLREQAERFSFQRLLRDAGDRKSGCWTAFFMQKGSFASPPRPESDWKARPFTPVKPSEARMCRRWWNESASWRRSSPPFKATLPAESWPFEPRAATHRKRPEPRPPGKRACPKPPDPRPSLSWSAATRRRSGSRL